MRNTADLLERSRAEAAAELAQALRGHAEPIPAPDSFEEFGTLFDRFADAKIVLLGESSHGTSEFYQARAAVTRRLIERHGFTILAVEADWPDAALVDRYVRNLPPQAPHEPPFQRFPRWMWRNTEMAALIEWIRTNNG